MEGVRKEGRGWERERQRRFFLRMKCQLIYIERRRESENPNFADIMVITALGKTHQ